MYCREDYEFFEPLDDFGFEYDEPFNHYYSVDNDSSTLVIHPDDPTTDFLKGVYCRDKNFDVINDPFIDSGSIEEYIIDHRRIIALGHGCDSGLFCASSMIIDSSLVPILKEKELVCIWCNADQFMLKNDLRGFYSGMFISEVAEANIYKIKATQEQITASNELFGSLLGKYIDSKGDVLAKLKKEYHIKDNPITTFNRNRLYST